MIEYVVYHFKNNTYYFDCNNNYRNSSNNCKRFDTLMDGISRVTLISRRVEAVINEVELLEDAAPVPETTQDPVTTVPENSGAEETDSGLY